MRDSSKLDAGQALAEANCPFTGVAGSLGLAFIAVRDDDDKDAIAKCATPLAGDESDSAIYQPTVLTNATQEMRIFKAESFGPMIAISRFDTEDEALARANNTEREAQMPFGGFSGYDRFGGRAAICELTDLCWITIEGPNQHYPIWSRFRSKT